MIRKKIQMEFFNFHLKNNFSSDSPYLIQSWQRHLPRGQIIVADILLFDLDVKVDGDHLRLVTVMEEHGVQTLLGRVGDEDLE